MTKLKLIVTVFLLLSAVKVSYSQDGQAGGMKFFEGTWEEVLQKSKEEGKPIFVDAYAEWCGPCKWMTENVFTTEEAGEFYNENFIVYKLDMEKGEGPEFAKKYWVTMYPLFLYIDSDGEVIHSSAGSRPVEDFVKEGQIALDKKYEQAEK